MPKPQLRVLSDVDGRSAAARRARALTLDLIRDIGGDPTAAQRAMIDRLAFSIMVLEDAETGWFESGKIDPTSYGTLVGHARRLVECLGLHERSNADATSHGIAIIRRTGRSAA